MRPGRRTHAATVLVVAGALMVASRPVAAHNAHVHQPMTDFAYQVMRLVALPDPPERLTEGSGVDPAEWAAWLAAVGAAVPKLRALPAGLPAQEASRCFPPPSTEPPSDWAVGATLGTIPYAVDGNYLVGSQFDCGVDDAWTPGPAFAAFGPGEDRAGTVLGFWAQHVDDEGDDFHGYIKPLNALGIGYLKQKLAELWDQGLTLLLVPFVCLGNCLFGAFGDCDDCIEQAKQAASGTNPVNAIESMLPGFGDFTGGTYTGLWHFVNVRPGASNDYDDCQGMLYEEAGPTGTPGAIDVGIMVVADAIGLTVNASESLGVGRYQIGSGGDGHPDTAPMRGKGAWEVAAIGHIAFEPVDNIGFYGWRKFRNDPAHSAKWLAWPLHALGDATVPMHVAGTTSWGHRPYEDAQERLYDKMVGRDGTPLQQLMLARTVLVRGFEWYRFIQQWRAANGSGDVPVRELITELAGATYAYSLLAGGPGSSWPFDDGASVEYLVGDDSSVDAYIIRPGAVELGRPLLFDGMGAIMAFLTAATEVLP